MSRWSWLWHRNRTGAQAPEPRPALSVDAITELLRVVVRAGILHTSPEHRGLFVLACVRRRACVAGLPATDDGLMLGLRDVLADAAAALGDGPYGQAAQVLCGATAGARGRPLAERRRLAAYALDVLPGWFRRQYEPRILESLAAEVWRTEAAALRSDAAEATR